MPIRLAGTRVDCYAPRVFGIGYLELMVLGLLVILLFPPRELPKLARSAARAYGSVRRIADDFHRNVMLDEELRGPIDEIRGVYDEARWDIRRAGDRLKKEVASVNESVNDGIKGALSPNQEGRDQEYDHDHDHFDEDASEQDFGDNRYDDGGEEEYLALHEDQAPPSARRPEAKPDPHEAYRNPYAGEPELDEHPPGAFESSEMPPSFKPVPRSAPPPGTLASDSDSSQGAASPGSLPPAAAEDATTPPLGVNTTAPTSAPTHPSLVGRVAASGASVPGAVGSLPIPGSDPVRPKATAPTAPTTGPTTGPKPSRAGPAAPAAAMPPQDSDEIDDSALTRVTRLPMPPSLQKPNSESSAGPKADKPQS